MKTMILVWGASERGKSQSLKRLAKKMPFLFFISPWHNDDYDSYVKGIVKGNDGECDSGTGSSSLREQKHRFLRNLKTDITMIEQ